jgi:ArsR family transcriptional regulator, arsenate/arsenite/antimonite-responsive transcriptional repressor / arsenate reductase (thioredoxin)
VRASRLEIRAGRHAALGDPVRLAIVDSLASSDRSPVELRRLTGIESNLLAHHLDVLEHAGIVSRTRSSGDGRRRYVRLDRSALVALGPQPVPAAARALFVCTRNSARSQLAAALWTSVTSTPAESAGTHPADRIDARAISAARRARLPLAAVAPRSIVDVPSMPPLVVTVCDQAHEELDPPDDWLHWSVPDPVAIGTPAAFDATIVELRQRVQALVGESGRT